MRARVAAAVTAACLGALMTGCVSVPTTGPVVSVEQAPSDEAEGVNIPTGPVPGSSPSVIVSDFLDAMEAYPVSTTVAAQFLTAEAAQRWRPGRGTVVYDERATSELSHGTVSLEVDQRVRLTGRGTYRPVRSGPGLHQELFSLVRVDGEWRIANPPDRLFIRSYFFERYFARFDLYFLDPTREALVADPVFLPLGDQLTTELVRGLIAGPTPWLGPQAATSLPDSAQIEVSVPLRDDGVAEVNLSAAAAELSDRQQQALSAQLVWTLRQVAGVEALRITADGTPLGIGGADDLQPVDAWPQYDPSGPSSRDHLFALDRGGVLTEAGENGPVDGSWGRRRLSDFGIDPYVQQVAGVDQTGRFLVAGPLTVTEPSLTTRRYTSAGRLTDPQWDRTGLLWVLDHVGADTSWVVVGEKTRTTLPVGALGRARVGHLAVSPDGARVAALVRQWDGPVWGGGRISGPCVVIARVVRGADGRVVRRLDHEYALRIPGLEVRQLRDLAWSTPSSVVVLADVAPLPPQPLELAIDGSSVVGGPESTDDLLAELGGVTLASAGVADALTVVGTRAGKLWALGSDGHWSVLETGLFRPHYPG